MTHTYQGFPERVCNVISNLLFHFPPDDILKWSIKFILSDSSAWQIPITKPIFKNE